MPSPMKRFKAAYNAFMGRSPTKGNYYYGGSISRQDRIRRRIQNERSIVNSIYNRISVDCGQINLKHVRTDEDGNYESTINSKLNRLLSLEANMDQTGREFVRDAVYSMLDEGCVALFPTDTTADPNITDSYDVEEARVGKIIQWFPKEVLLEVYNEMTGKKERILSEKRYTPIIENPFFSIMNEPNSTLQRLIRVLNQLDRVNEENSDGKMNIIVQLPYTVRSEVQQKHAEERRKNIEAQLTNNKYGIAYVDGTEKIIQLNRPIESNLWEQSKELKSDLFNEMGITMEILNGTADDKTMLNYYSRIIEPILTSIIEAIERTWLSRTAQSQNQGIRFFRDPFKLIPVTELAEIADKLTRNEIMSSNEIRVRIGLPPSNDPKADKLLNSNLNHPEEETTIVENKDEEITHGELYHYGIPRRSGRYPYGSGERPFQGDKKNPTKYNDISTKKKRSGGFEEDSYRIKDDSGNVISEIKTYDYNIDGFDWILLADVVTSPSHRKQGLATRLIEKAYDDIKENKKEKGLYLFVKSDNQNAISLYKKLGFDNVKNYELKDGEYFIMKKGNGNTKQFDDFNFS